MNIAIYTNILTPYRTYFYNIMYEECKRQGGNFHVILMADAEPNRNWKYEEYKTNYTILLNHKTFARGETYIHFNSNLKGVLSELDLDVLICAGSYVCPGIWDALRLEKKLGYKTFFWSESHLNESRNFAGIKVRVREFLRKAVYKKFDGFWYAGKMSKQFIETYCAPTAKFLFMPNLVEEEKYKVAAVTTDKEKMQLKAKYHVLDGQVVFVCPARLSPVKGIDKFIPVFSKVQNCKKATLFIAGDGELKDRIERMVEEYDLDVRLLGFQNQKTIIELYSMADVFLLPSLSDPNPLTCIEALWAGLPLFISEHCGNYPEVINQGINGYSFSYENKEEMTQKLDNLICASKEWKCYARGESQRIANKLYCSKNVVERILLELGDSIKK